MAVVDHNPGTITIDPSPLAPDSPARCTVTLIGATTVAGTVAIAASVPGNFSEFPANIHFNAGESSASVAVHTSPTASGSATLSATANGVTVYVVASIAD